MSLDILRLIFFSTLDTLYMVGIAGLIATLLGLPLTIAATPFIARLVEAAVREVDQGLVEMARP